MTFRTLIIDNDPAHKQKLLNLLTAHEDVRVTGQAGSFDQAVGQLTRKRFDLVFLDPCLGKKSGFDLLPRMNNGSLLVFVTRRKKYAVRAFELNVLDYILKPVSPSRLAKTIFRVESQKDFKNASSKRDGIFVKLDSGGKYVDFKDITAVSSIGGNYLCLFLQSAEKVFCRGTLRSWEAVLAPDKFLRIHRSAIIRLDHVQKIRKRKNGSLSVSLFEQPGTFTASRRMAPKLKGFVNSHLF